MMQGLILFGHGARDPRWAEPFERLRARIVAREPQVTVVLAYLELMTPDLASAVQDLARSGATAITVVPVFFGQGGHVRRDLPELVARIAAAHPAVTLRVAGTLGENDAVLDALAAACSAALRATD
jgi:sirohydrochlorin cobaltochelatase